MGTWCLSKGQPDRLEIFGEAEIGELDVTGPSNLVDSSARTLLGTSATLVVTSATLVVTGATLVVTGATLVVTGALLVVTRSY